MVDLSGQMVLIIKELLKKIFLMGMEYFIGQMEQDMKVCGKRVSNMVQDDKFMLMEERGEDSGKTVNGKDGIDKLYSNFKII